MRFCMITTFYPPYHFGGDAMFVYRLSNELARRGHTVHVIHAADAYRMLAGKPPTGSYPNHANVTLHPLEHTPAMLAPLITQQIGAPILDMGKIRQVLSLGFDVIHYHNVSLVGGPAILGMGDAIKLYTLHEYWLICPTHVLFKNQERACDKPECLPCILKHRRPPQLWRYTDAIKRAVRHVDAFLAPSRFVAEKHQERGLDLPSVHLPYFVPEPPLDAPHHDAPAKPYFLFVGRLEKLKGLHTLIPIFRQYRRARLLIAGTGADELSLRALAAGIDNITFLGQQSGDELRALYRHAVGVIIPSITFDISPQVALEAFTQHTPVIVRNIGGMPEMVTDSGGGYIYDDDVGLIAAMDALLDPAHRDQLGERGYQAYCQRWTADAHLQAYFALIERLAAERVASKQ